jgi:hypothetical protein
MVHVERAVARLDRYERGFFAACSFGFSPWLFHFS